VRRKKVNYGRVEKLELIYVVNIMRKFLTTKNFGFPKFWKGRNFSIITNPILFLSKGILFGG